MRKLLKAAFDEDVKFWTREDEAKVRILTLAQTLALTPTPTPTPTLALALALTSASSRPQAKCKALPMETLKSLAGMLHTLPHTEAVNATCAELDAADRQALKTVTKHVLRQLLEEVSAVRGSASGSRLKGWVWG